VQYDTTINDWHTCPNTARINASNPCSSTCSSTTRPATCRALNLTKFLSEEDGTLRRRGLPPRGARVLPRAGDPRRLLVVPDEADRAELHDYRPLGLGYANLGTLLMLLGLPYDSDEGRAVAAALTAILTGHAYRVSAEMAASKGPFAGYAMKNREPMLA
jgi:ribonucleoside-diphosphate reductase alpha chain